MAERTLKVSIVGDSKSLDRALGKASRSTRRFGQTFERSFGGFGRGAGASFAGGFTAAASAIIGPAIARQIKQSILGASALAEQISKSRAVFGQSSNAVEKFAKTAASSIGVAETAALEATGTFGNLFNSMGVADPAAATLSRQLVKLAADLASFNNAAPVDVLEALRSGLVGEAEPLRRFGVLLSAARVQQEALSETGKTSAKALTEQEKALARVALILRDTRQAQGDFARTSGSTANQSRELAASLENLRANVGKLVEPFANQLVGSLNDSTQAANTLLTKLDNLGKIRIPKIEIPIAVVQVPGTGGGIGEIAKEVFLQLNPATGPLRRTQELVDLVQKLLSDSERQSTRALADQFRKAVGTFPARRAADVTTAAAQAVPAFGQPGFKTAPNPIAVAAANAEKQAKRQRVATERAAKAAATAAEKQRDAFNALFASLQLKLDKSAATSGLKDDLAALDNAQRAIESQIRAEGKTTELERELFGIRQRRLDVRKRMADQARQAAQADQFKALGLTGEGGARTPGVANLKKQLEQLTARLGPDIAPKVAAQFAGVGKVLSGALGKVTDETRRKIVELFETIRGTFDQQSKGPLTKTTSLNTKKIVEGLGLGPDATKELRARLSGFNSAGLALARPAGVGAFGQVVPATGGATTETINVQLDGKTIATAVRKHDQKRARRNPPQKRGPTVGGRF